MGHPVFYLAILTLEPSLLSQTKISLDITKCNVGTRNRPLIVAHYVNRLINKMKMETQRDPSGGPAACVHNQRPSASLRAFFPAT